MASTPLPQTVGIFSGCLTSLYRPQVIEATALALTRLGFDVDVPMVQSCCGRVAAQSGDTAEALRLSEEVIDQFSRYDAVVSPTPSCALTMTGYAVQQPSNSSWQRRCRKLARKTYDLASFLELALRNRPEQAFRYHGRVALLQQQAVPSLLGSDSPLRRLLEKSNGIEVLPLRDMLPHAGLTAHSQANSMTSLTPNLIESIRECGAGLVTGDEIGLLIELKSALRRVGSGVEVMHFSEIL
ncbi:(Fe-S)-binding protein [Rhodobacteraceae bacterium RKSG542]|uniref:(Fe-S)-binding protein n=1 Tax=Pseudovibrio flavus TaxID=2529854 RepID=UPI0012BD6664|nr:(Fe-S)-binding protein [Pseudovibrio flavus]MTI15825.1 (Fe-S)-binding protein [Pseudovibrio flavus]